MKHRGHCGPLTLPSKVFVVVNVSNLAAMKSGTRHRIRARPARVSCTDITRFSLYLYSLQSFLPSVEAQCYYSCDHHFANCCFQIS